MQVWGEGSAFILEGGACRPPVGQSACLPPLHPAVGVSPLHPQPLVSGPAQPSPLSPSRLDSSRLVVPNPTPTGQPRPPEAEAALGGWSACCLRNSSPGRVCDMIKRRALRTRAIKLLVLVASRSYFLAIISSRYARLIPSIMQDEADEMLSRGFKDQIYDVYRYLPPELQVTLRPYVLLANVIKSMVYDYPICHNFTMVRRVHVANFLPINPGHCAWSFSLFSWLVHLQLCKYILIICSVPVTLLPVWHFEHLPHCWTNKLWENEYLLWTLFLMIRNDIGFYLNWRGRVFDIL